MRIAHIIIFCVQCCAGTKCFRKTRTILCVLRFNSPLVIRNTQIIIILYVVKPNHRTIIHDTTATTRRRVTSVLQVKKKKYKKQKKTISSAVFCLLQLFRRISGLDKKKKRQCEHALCHNGNIVFPPVPYNTMPTNGQIFSLLLIYLCQTRVYNIVLCIELDTEKTVYDDDDYSDGGGHVFRVALGLTAAQSFYERNQASRGYHTSYYNYTAYSEWEIKVTLIRICRS